MAYPATIPSHFALGADSVRAQFGFDYLGKQYAFVEQNAVGGVGDCKLHVMKSADAGQTWAEVASLLPDCAVFQFGAGTCYTLAKDGTNVIVIFARVTTNVPTFDGITVTTFNLTNDTFGASANFTPVQVPVAFSKYNKPPADTGDLLVFQLAVRGTSDYILFYSSAAENVGGTLRGRCSYSSFDGTTFAASVALPSQAGSSLSFLPVSCGCDPTSGRTHFVYTDSTGGVGNKIYHLGMDSLGAFGTVQAMANRLYLSGDPATVSQLLFYSGTLAFAAYCNDNIGFTTQSIQFFHATEALNPVWSVSQIYQATDGTLPNSLPMAGCNTGNVNAELTAAFKGGKLLVAWSWSDDNQCNASNGGVMYATADSGPLAWSVPALLWDITLTFPFYVPQQVYAYAMSGGIGVLGAAAKSTNPNSGAQVTQFQFFQVVSVTLSCGSPPSGGVGVPYSHTFAAAAGTPPYAYAITGGALPTGLTLSAAGAISGTPTAAGTFTFTIQATDSVGGTATADCAIAIVASVGVQTVLGGVKRRRVQP